MKILDTAEFKPAPKNQTINDILKREVQLSRKLADYNCVGKWVFVADQQLLAVGDSYDEIVERYDDDQEILREAGARTLRVFEVLGPDVNLVPTVLTRA